MARRVGEPFQLGPARMPAEGDELLTAAKYLDLPEAAGQDDLGWLTDRSPVEHQAARRALPHPDRRLAEHISSDGATLANYGLIIDVVVYRPQSVAENSAVQGVRDRWRLGTERRIAARIDLPRHAQRLLARRSHVRIGVEYGDRAEPGIP